MPLLLLAMLVPTGALALRSVTDGVTDVTDKSTPNLIAMAAAGVGLYIAYKAVTKRGR